MPVKVTIIRTRISLRIKFFFTCTKSSNYDQRLVGEVAASVFTARDKGAGNFEVTDVMGLVLAHLWGEGQGPSQRPQGPVTGVVWNSSQSLAVGGTARSCLHPVSLDF